MSEKLGVNCINCSNNLDNEYIYPSKDCKKNDFKIYICNKCSFENEGWMFSIPNEINRQSITRAYFFESFYHNNEINYDDSIKYIKNFILNRDEKHFQLDNEDEINEKIRRDIHAIFSKFKNKNVLIQRNDADTPNEKYEKIIISQDNKFEIFFNKRLIRPWDFIYIKSDLNLIKKEISTNGNIKCNERWQNVIDFFLNY